MDIKKDYNEYFFEPFCEAVGDTWYDANISYALKYDDLSDVKSVYNWIIHAARMLAMNETQEPEWSRETLIGILDNVYNLLLAKNADYGGSVFRSPMFAPGMPVDAAVRVRMSDKWNRYNNLVDKNESEVPTETLHDTLYDFIGYAVILCMIMNSGGETAQEGELSENAILVYYPGGMSLSELRDRVSSCDVQIIPIQ